MPPEERERIYAQLKRDARLRAEASMRKTKAELQAQNALAKTTGIKASREASIPILLGISAAVVATIVYFKRYA